MERLVDVVVPAMLLAPIALKMARSTAQHIGLVKVAAKIDDFMRTVSWYTRLS